MYRVELKDLPLKENPFLWSLVPNVPCGVESKWRHKGAFDFSHKAVPNVPCGVESGKN